jgi:hypothetical protein
MPLDVFLAMLTFSVAVAFTPGPNNIMLAVSGVNFGFGRTVPHMVGITAGFLALLTACGFGLGLVFAAVPALQLLLKIAGALYMLWLAFKRDRNLCAAGPRAYRLPGVADRAGGVHGRIGGDLGRIRRGVAPAAARPAARTAVQRDDGIAAGRQHRADGALTGRNGRFARDLSAVTKRPRSWAGSLG